MTNHSIDNTVSLDDVILWQYQHAWNLKAMVDFFSNVFKDAVADFWDTWRDKIFNIEASEDDDLDKFSLSLWGIVLGCPRPTYKDGSTNVPISDDLYRRILKARFRIMRTNASIPAILTYVNDIFGKNGTCDVMVEDTADMALHFSVKHPNNLDEEEESLVLDNPDGVFVYPAGVKTNERIAEIVFGFDGQQNNRSSNDPMVGGLDDSTFANDWSISV